MLTYRASDIALVASERNSDATVFSLRSCARCNDSAKNVVQLFLSSKTGTDESLSGKELESWREEYDAETKGERLHLHAGILESNKKVIDEIFEKQKIMETYERDRVALETAKTENQKLRQELFQQIMKHETEMRRMEQNKQVITEVLERNEKALKELKSTQEENLDLKRELLKNIMAKQADVKKLTASKQALTVAMQNQEMTLNELKKSRDENLCLKRELLEHLHHHKEKMEALQMHKESLQEIVTQHTQNIKDMEAVKKSNLELQEELVNSMMAHKADAAKLATCEGWLEVLKDEVALFEKDRTTLKLVRRENERLGEVVGDVHEELEEIRCELQERINKDLSVKASAVIALGQLGILGMLVHCVSPA